MTAFPGIMVEEMRITGEGGTVSSDFDVPLTGENVTEGKVRGFLEENLPEMGSGGFDALTYTLLVKGASRPTAKAKARGFARLKNPFEPDIIDVSVMGTPDTEGVLKTYRVRVSVRK